MNKAPQRFNKRCGALFLPFDLLNSTVSVSLWGSISAFIAIPAQSQRDFNTFSALELFYPTQSRVKKR
ncbi:hypothetical protein HMPREF7215_0679 [Pyramidobacter piscolens W5455]|uniref:Uncharacterized protein n=1 Tax=Pyramidobacter piscolens W5455 TaxID=352165 RepID=A0ABM9ZW24_9BACT|nr:hypothetical protein HMPREF7215_0679 [Pyramidobacter piscolens W5455]